MEELKEYFIVFPTSGYWEIDGKPVSSEEAQYGLNPDAIWMLINEQ